MKYAELSNEEQYELRNNLYMDSLHSDGYTDFDFLSAEEQDVVRACIVPGEIPEEIMLSAYGNYDFVPEDFFINNLNFVLEEIA